MTRISLDQAIHIVTAALAEGARLGLKPITVVVLDAGGVAIAMARQDGSSNFRPAIATAKASAALGLGVNSRSIGAMATERPSFIAAVAALAPDGVVPAAGGVLVLGADGLPIGAVGVTGDTSDNDELCALAGIRAAGLSPQG
jgi:uncharacterized protein GlcG (DUF336 family)